MLNLTIEHGQISSFGHGSAVGFVDAAAKAMRAIRKAGKRAIPGSVDCFVYERLGMTGPCFCVRILAFVDVDRELRGLWLKHELREKIRKTEIGWKLHLEGKSR